MITFIQYFNEQNVAGGSDGVFGPGTRGAIGSFGNQFPSQNDAAYAPEDYRVATVLGAKKDKNKRKRKRNMPIQRRSLPGL